MNPNLKPSESLSQVVFIHDYIQLVFQDERFNVYNLSEIEVSGKRILWGESGFCDALVSLISHSVISVSTAPHKLALAFDEGSHFRILAIDEAKQGPDAFEFLGPNNLFVVEPNT